LETASSSGGAGGLSSSTFGFAFSSMWPDTAEAGIELFGPAI
jgi:hypothetical protein